MHERFNLVFIDGRLKVAVGMSIRHSERFRRVWGGPFFAPCRPQHTHGFAAVEREMTVSSARSQEFVDQRGARLAACS